MKIKPCPKCGSKNLTINPIVTPYPSSVDFHCAGVIKCKSCGMSFMDCFGQGANVVKDLLIKSWNKNAKDCIETWEWEQQMKANGK